MWSVTPSSSMFRAPHPLCITTLIEDFPFDKVSPFNLSFSRCIIDPHFLISYDLLRLWKLKGLIFQKFVFLKISPWPIRNRAIFPKLFSQEDLLFFCLINFNNILQNLMSLKWMKRNRRWTLPSSPFFKKRLPFLYILLYIMQDSTNLSISILDALQRIYPFLKLFKDKSKTSFLLWEK